MKIIDSYKKNPTYFCLWIFIIIFSIIIFGLIFLPSVFYDQWIWKHYWGPTVADAFEKNVSFNGVIAHEGYTIISELTYGFILIFAIYGIYRLLKKLKIVIDWKFALALMPYILYGPASRVLEDAGLFNEPTVYWFISPFIYLQIALFAICFLLLGYYLEKKFDNTRITVYADITSLHLVEINMGETAVNKDIIILMSRVAQKNGYHYCALTKLSEERIVLFFHDLPTKTTEEGIKVA